MLQKSSRNAHANANNRYQGEAKRVLCICSAGMLRSITAANVLHKEFGFNTRSAGVGDYALIPVSTVLLEWADEILLMEPNQKLQLLSEITQELGSEAAEGFGERMIVLGIPDQWDYMHEDLQSIILTAYNELGRSK